MSEPNQPERILFITTGGTIDKVYFDASSEFEVGESVVEHILREALVTFDVEMLPLMRKDSLELDDADRASVRDAVAAAPYRHIIVTHGTDTMSLTAQSLQDVGDKVVVFTGALSPARFRTTDAVFNIGLAVAGVQCLDAGVYVAMNGRLFPAEQVSKNKSLNQFEVSA